MIRIYFTNLGWYSGEEFSTLNEAIAYAKTKCYDCCFEQNNTVLGTWGILTGFIKLEHE